jgi:hypothetical protein
LTPFGRERLPGVFDVAYLSDQTLPTTFEIEALGTALALARHWSLIQIDQKTPVALQRWSISTREFRENLEWAVVVPRDGEIAPAVAQVLDELLARGITVHDSCVGDWWMRWSISQPRLQINRHKAPRQSTLPLTNFHGGLRCHIQNELNL